jgi:hypothetical protein
MTITFILVAFGLFALIFLLLVARGRGLAIANPEELAKNIRPVDIEAFRNLIDPAEQQFLRLYLSAAQFRIIHRERLRAAIDYIRAASHNASVLLRLGEAARRSLDPAVVEAGDKLVESALRLRIYAFQAIAKLYIAILLPAWQAAPTGFTEDYERMTRIVVLLGCLRFPTQGVAAAL